MTKAAPKKTQDQCDHVRRSCVLTVLAAALLPSRVPAHTPYKQWAVYRQKHLLIGCHKDLPQTYELAQKVVATLDTELPAASARIARAPATTRLASLLATDQLNTAIVTPDIAKDMLEGNGIFSAYGPIALTTLLPLKDLVLVGHRRLKDHHTWQITSALETITAVDLQQSVPTLPWHPGSEAFVKGLPVPAHD